MPILFECMYTRMLRNSMHRCYVALFTNRDATQQGGWVGGVGGMLTFLARHTNIHGGWDVNVPCTLEADFEISL